jgi:hypothetical protein
MSVVVKPISLDTWNNKLTPKDKLNYLVHDILILLNNGNVDIDDMDNIDQEINNFLKSTPPIELEYNNMVTYRIPKDITLVNMGQVRNRILIIVMNNDTIYDDIIPQLYLKPTNFPTDFKFSSVGGGKRKSKSKRRSASRRKRRTTKSKK